jgi:hypothetical protein
MTPDALSLISESLIQVYFDRLSEELSARGIESTRDDKGGVGKEPLPQEALRAPSIEKLAHLVSQIPNDYASHKEYMRFMYAIRAAAGDDVVDALGIAQEWSARWEGGYNDPERVEDDFLSLNGPFHVGWQWLLHEARRRGVNTAAYVFEPVPPPGEPNNPPKCGDFQVALDLAGGLGKRWTTLSAELEAIHRLMPKLRGKQRAVVKAAAIGTLQTHLGRAEARELFSAHAASKGEGAF